MSLPLKDFRLGIPEAVDKILDAEARAFGKDKATVAREVLREWARRRAHACKIVQAHDRANGLQAELNWQGLEEDGADAR